VRMSLPSNQVNLKSLKNWSIIYLETWF
jgi:hypothetical protein